MRCLLDTHAFLWVAIAPRSADRGFDAYRAMGLEILW
jgi:PIN domain nuclease of toxin-antitoxin system